MFPKSVIPECANRLAPYEAGRRTEEVMRELGLASAVKLSSNENCLGPSPRALKALRAALPEIHRYGDAASAELKEAICQKLGVPQECVICANGSSEFILVLSHLILGPGLHALMSKPSFSLYFQNAAASGAEITEAPLKNFAQDLEALKSGIRENTRLVFLDNPVNPTGSWAEAKDIEAFAGSLPPECLLMLDEAYVEFSRAPLPDYQKLLASGQVIILRTFSKLYGLAGLRAGYALMDPLLAGAVNKIRQPFNINALAQLGAAAALNDDDYVQKSKEAAWAGLDWLARELPRAGMPVFPSQANFIMADTGKMDARDFAQALFREGVIVRALNPYGLTHHVRITVGLPEENQALVNAVIKVLKEGA
jgi:histidinol-phosphate aminotransferase